MNRAAKMGLAVLLVVIAEGSSWSAQTPPLRQVMRAKLDHSQRILEAVVTSNWEQLNRESRALAGVTQDAAWSALKTPSTSGIAGRFSGQQKT